MAQGVSLRQRNPYAATNAADFPAFILTPWDASRMRRSTKSVGELRLVFFAIREAEPAERRFRSSDWQKDGPSQGESRNEHERINNVRSHQNWR
jgi:hypothetical protein